MKDEGYQFKYLMQCALFLSFPKFCYWFLKKKLGEGKLDTPDYVRRVGTMYQNLNTQKKSVYLFTAFFLMRRFIHAYSTIFFGELYLNLYTNFFSSLFILKFYFDQQPLLDNFSNKTEIFNELFVFLSNYFLIVLSDLIPDVEYR